MSYGFGPPHEPAPGDRVAHDGRLLDCSTFGTVERVFERRSRLAGTTAMARVRWDSGGRSNAATHTLEYVARDGERPSNADTSYEVAYQTAMQTLHDDALGDEEYDGGTVVVRDDDDGTCPF